MKKIEELINNLRGSCKNLYEGMDDIDYPSSELSDEDIKILNSEIFECEICNWWYEIDEMSREDQVCVYCKEID